MSTAAIAGDRRVIEVRSPATGAVIGTAPILEPGEVRALVDRARAAQPAWSALGPRRRGRLLLRFRDRLVERAEEVAELSSVETGKTRFEALISDVLVTADLARWYARRAPESSPVAGSPPAGYSRSAATRSASRTAWSA